MTSPDISEGARLAYAAGVHPVDHAEQEITTLIGIHRQLVRHGALTGIRPAGDLSAGALARRVIGMMLAAGWEPPGGLEFPEEGPVNVPAPVTRPDGRVYQPLKIAAYAVADEDEILSGVAVLGTHDMAVAQRLADEYAAWQLGTGSVALNPETGWFREGLSSSQRVWMRDPVKGRAGVMFHEIREGL